MPLIKRVILFQPGNKILFNCEGKSVVGTYVRGGSKKGLLVVKHDGREYEVEGRSVINLSTKRRPKSIAHLL